MHNRAKGSPLHVVSSYFIKHEILIIAPLSFTECKVEC